MQGSMTLDQLDQMRGSAVYSSDGDKIGSIEEIFYDEQTNRPEWIGIGTGFFSTKRVLVPVEGASFEDDRVNVPYGKDQVKDSPDVDSDEISQSLEADLYAYYGLGYSEQRSDSGLPEGSAGMTRDVERKRDTGDMDLTRSEEELRVGKREVEAGRVRLRKWVETEPVQADVELRHETVHVERQSIDEVVSGADIGEQEIEVPLHEEQAVVQKRVVAKERIALDKDVETEQETITDEVRKERVEVEGADDVENRRR
ncbi:MAG: PRC and DUF2382 domain-containing protein [Actinobacteria bacterium]|nr:PRC and DUF2382 domain-containing protein [Actinomycetota bacterium]